MADKVAVRAGQVRVSPLAVSVDGMVVATIPVPVPTDNPERMRVKYIRIAQIRVGVASRHLLDGVIQETIQSYMDALRDDPIASRVQWEWLELPQMVHVRREG